MNPMAEYLIQTRRNPLPMNLAEQVAPKPLPLKPTVQPGVNKAREIAGQSENISETLQEAKGSSSAAKGLSTGAKVGIGVGVLAVLGGGVWFFMSRK